VLDRALAEFPEPKQAEWQTFDSANERKLASKDDSTMGEATRQLLAELNSATFIDFLERLTGIPGLVPDPHFVGGGLHQIERGGHLKIHADFNRHPGTGLERRLNVLLYLNRDWKPEFGGAFELWNRDMTASDAQIMPFFNRCVIFTTTDTSFHGHPEPLACPEGRTRKSIALYYYSRDAPAGQSGDEHNTLFQARPGEELETPEGRSRKLKPRLKAAARQVTPPIVLDAVRRRRHRA
jgi:Rps23 Pro-64 3,4-dihydroxylase Tpa1-like proline 4-hydroxylase